MHSSEVRIPENDNVVVLWRLRGHEGYWYPTKGAAEAAARLLWPHEDITVRYSRIYYANFVREDSL